MATYSTCPFFVVFQYSLLHTLMHTSGYIQGKTGVRCQRFRVAPTHPCTQMTPEHSSHSMHHCYLPERAGGKQRAIRAHITRSVPLLCEEVWWLFLRLWKTQRQKERWGESKVKMTDEQQAERLQIGNLRVLKWILQVKYKLTSINTICDMIENNSNYYYSSTCNRSLWGK